MEQRTMETKADSQKPSEPKPAAPKKGKIRAFLGSTKGQLLSEEECVISYLGGDAKQQLTRFNMTCNPK
jgi:hypothetical protein